MGEDIKLSWQYRCTHIVDALVSSSVAGFGHVNEAGDEKRSWQH